MVLGTSDCSRGTMSASRKEGWDFADDPRSQESGDDASGAGTDAAPADGDEQASEGTARNSSGRPVARSSRNADRPWSESRKIYLDGENDVLRRLSDVSERCRGPERYYLGVLVFPKDADGRTRLVADQMVPTTSGSAATPAVRNGLKPPERPRPR
jgi:hypothetical protein